VGEYVDLGGGLTPTSDWDLVSYNGVTGYITDAGVVTNNDINTGVIPRCPGGVPAATPAQATPDCATDATVRNLADSNLPTTGPYTISEIHCDGDYAGVAGTAPNKEDVFLVLQYVGATGWQVIAASANPTWSNSPSRGAVPLSTLSNLFPGRVVAGA
jgi:hypothetical protein